MDARKDGRRDGLIHYVEKNLLEYKEKVTDELKKILRLVFLLSKK